MVRRYGVPILRANMVEFAIAFLVNGGLTPLKHLYSNRSLIKNIT